MDELPHPDRSARPRDLASRADDALRSDADQGHPLRLILEEIRQYLELRVGRIESISSLSQHRTIPANDASFSQLFNRLDRQVNRLEKAIRISDLYQAGLNSSNRSLRQASTHDLLTGLPNRQFLTDCCQREDERASRNRSTYSLIAIDADHFKSINDTYGHDVGDQVLIALAQRLSSSLRDGDYCARWGGEEFLALLVGADLGVAQIVAQRLLDGVRALALPVDGAVVYPRVSLGLAERLPGETFLDVYRRADEAQLLAKRQGRDRYVCAA